MTTRLRTLACCAFVFVALTCSSGGEFRVAETSTIDSVPSWFPVGFCLLTHGGDHVVAYYNEQHHIVVAGRAVATGQWQKVMLRSKVGWDSHNYITMAVDTAEYLHLAGNMHCVPLTYFRTTKPRDITTFTRFPMTGREEKRCTYPRFMKDGENNLLFMYRSTALIARESRLAALESKSGKPAVVDSSLWVQEGASQAALGSCGCPS